MSKKHSRILWIYAILVHISLIGSLIGLFWAQIERKQAEKSLSAYRVANGKNVARIEFKQEIRDIQKAIEISPAPEGLVWAIRVHENGMPGHEYGMKKFFADKNQLESCIYLIQQEMVKYVYKHKREFVKQVSARYNYKDMQRWNKSTLYLWVDYENKKEVEK